MVIHEVVGAQGPLNVTGMRHGQRKGFRLFLHGPGALGGHGLRCGGPEGLGDDVQVVDRVEDSQAVTAHGVEERCAGHGAVAAERNHRERGDDQQDQGEQNQKNVQLCPLE